MHIHSIWYKTVLYDLYGQIMFIDFMICFNLVNSGKFMKSFIERLLDSHVRNVKLWDSHNFVILSLNLSNFYWTVYYLKHFSHREQTLSF